MQLLCLLVYLCAGTEKTVVRALLIIFQRRHKSPCKASMAAASNSLHSLREISICSTALPSSPPGSCPPSTHLINKSIVRFTKSLRLFSIARHRRRHRHRLRSTKPRSSPSPALLVRSRASRICAKGGDERRRRRRRRRRRKSQGGGGLNNTDA